MDHFLWPRILVVPTLVGGIVWTVRGFILLPYGGQNGSIRDRFTNAWIGLVIGSFMGTFWIISIPTYLSLQHLENI